MATGHCSSPSTAEIEARWIRSISVTVAIRRSQRVRTLLRVGIAVTLALCGLWILFVLPGGSLMQSRLAPWGVGLAAVVSWWLDESRDISSCRKIYCALLPAVVFLAFFSTSKQIGTTAIALLAGGMAAVLLRRPISGPQASRDEDEEALSRNSIQWINGYLSALAFPITALIFLPWEVTEWVLGSWMGGILASILIPSFLIGLALFVTWICIAQRNARDWRWGYPAAIAMLMLFSITLSLRVGSLPWM